MRLVKYCGMTGEESTQERGNDGDTGTALRAQRAENSPATPSDCRQARLAKGHQSTKRAPKPNFTPPHPIAPPPALHHTPILQAHPKS